MSTPVSMNHPLKEWNGRGKSTSKLPRFARTTDTKQDLLSEVNGVKRQRLDFSMETGKSDMKPPSTTRKPVPRRPQGKLRRSVSLSALPNQTKTTVPKKPIAVATRVAVDSLKRNVNRPPVPPSSNVNRPPVPPSSNENRPPVPPSAAIRKRPAWDLKGKLEDLDKKYKSVVSTKTDLENKLAEYTDKAQETDALKYQLSQINSDYSQLEFEFRNLKLEKDNLENENKQIKEENIVLKEKKNELEAENLKFQKEMRINSEKMSIITDELENMKNENKLLSKNVKDLKDSLTQLNEKRSREEIIRRTLHNTIMELKGNIRVFCRVRPPLQCESSKEVLSMEFASPEGNKILMKGSNKYEGCGSNNRAHNIEFSFDKVFEPNATQHMVFEEISQLIQSSLDGYHVCVFAYGQTGSGKTYTMEGPNELDDSNSGMIRRSVNQVFENVEDLSEKGWKYVIEVSIVEIYNEAVRDLLRKKSSKSDLPNCDLKMRDNEVVVNDTTVVVVKTREDVYRLLKSAHKNRAVATTKCNDHSSRSHSVFTMKITGDNESTGQKCHGALNLIDLAGSERLKQSESVGLRLKETKHINTSLSTLGTVIMSLAQKAEHIPFRNSKLTYLLRNSLGGQSKMLMFVNISPLREHEQETLNSLRFAKQVNECHIGPPLKK